MNLSGKNATEKRVENRMARIGVSLSVAPIDGALILVEVNDTALHITK